ncbi:MAG: hypothetical protein QM757_26525 [Paludibaculum sp.]
MATAKKNAAINRIPSRPLPPDPAGKNDDSAERAQEALDAFRSSTVSEEGKVLMELISDLAHWADRHNYDLGAAICSAISCYDEETGGKGHQFDSLEAL